ncbi:methyl-accepting chemotaxis protein [Sphaerotilaceae bacterium SBD11-9]
MKFRTKIWSLPVSAAVVLVAGVAISAAIGARLSAGVDKLRSVDDPYLAAVTQVASVTENVRLTVQTAAAEGDIDRLKDVEALVKSGHEALDGMGKLVGKSESAGQLRGAFDAYQGAAAGAAKGMIDKQPEAMASVQKMQSAQKALDQVLAQAKLDARAQVDAQYEAASAAVKTSLIATMLTGLVVLLALGAVSWVIVNSVWKDLGEEPDQLCQAARRIASGELDLAVKPGAHAESLQSALAQMAGGLREMVTQIRITSDSIATASNEIATGNLDLSQRTERTASNLQQTASSMEQLTGSVRHTAESAHGANQLASSASGVAAKGGAVVGEVVSVMEQISASSKKIADIISVIDGISFQTNILALNAAVEAARAGEQGRGFAVVAAEVRSLAQRSAQAAKEIKGLIGESVDRVESGSRLVQDAGSTMNQIVDSVKRVTDIIGEITAASNAQSTDIGQVNGTVTQLDQMTQQNAALVEQSSAAAESLREQAGQLARAVARFRVGGVAAHA